MIQSKEDLKRYLDIETKLYGKKWYYFLPFTLTESQILYKHAIYLRKAEYGVNCHKVSRFWYKFKLLHLQTKFGLRIPLNVAEEGLYFPHLGFVIINEHARVGKNCTMHADSKIVGSQNHSPIVGDNVYLGMGSIVMGDTVLADDIMVGANAVVNKSCDVKGAILAGVPAKVVRVRNEGD